MQRQFIQVLGFWSLLSHAVVAQEGGAAGLREELDSLKSDYEKRIERLESRIRDLESQTEGPGNTGLSSKVMEKKAKEDREYAAALERENLADARERAAKMATNESFMADTEIRDLSRRAASESALSERIGDVLEGYLDISGYFRAGYGRSDEGGPQRAFGLPGFAKYRLGNETENYGELLFSKTFYPIGAFRGGNVSEDDPVARVLYRLSFVNPYEDYGSSADTDYATPEIWASLANVIPGVPGAKLWAGNRFYRRHDIHLNDFYFWDMSGGGGGIEDVPLGNGKLAFAWIGDGAQSAIYNQQFVSDPLNLAGFSKTNLDLRYYDWDFFGGEGEIGLVYASTNSGIDSNGMQTDDSDGVSLNLVRTDKAFLDQESLHKLSFQIGTGPAKTFNSGFETFSDETGTYIRADPSDSWRFRVTDQIVVKATDDISIGGALIYQYTDFAENLPDQQWISGGVRPIWHLTENFSIALEGGVDWASNTIGGEGGTLGKLTLAPQVSLGDEFFSRPSLRAFLTYAKWSEGLEGQVGGLDYADSTSGWTWGLQMESWW